MRVYFKYNKNTDETSLYGDEEALKLFQVENITNNEEEVLLSVVIQTDLGSLAAPPTLEEEEFENG
jgi:hypothetical protein